MHAIARPTVASALTAIGALTLLRNKQIVIVATAAAMLRARSGTGTSTLCDRKKSRTASVPTRTAHATAVPRMPYLDVSRPTRPV